MDITASDVTGLGEKLTALDLTEGERSLLGLILSAAGDDEVVGFAASDPIKTYFAIAPLLIGPSGDQLGRRISAPPVSAEATEFDK